jgi:predicted metal-dependent HD superfamily phosphohydrolase
MTLQERYAQPWRHFHTWDHIARVRRATEWYYRKLNMKLPVGVESAILWHDAVYLPGATDNEEKTAQLYRDTKPTAWQFRDAYTDWVCSTILATKEHKASSSLGRGLYNAANVVLSCDLVSLAAPWNQFCIDAENVCKEYRYAYDAQVVREGRLHFYEEMLKRTTLYPHPFFERTHGPRARRNLQSALDWKMSGVPT